MRRHQSSGAPVAGRNGSLKPEEDAATGHKPGRGPLSNCRAAAHSRKATKRKSLLPSVWLVGEFRIAHRRRYMRTTTALRPLDCSGASARMKSAKANRRKVRQTGGAQPGCG